MTNPLRGSKNDQMHPLSASLTRPTELQSQKMLADFKVGDDDDDDGDDDDDDDDDDGDDDDLHCHSHTG